MMMKYSEIKLTDEEKKILEWFKDQEYTDVFRKDDYDRIAFYDGTTGTEYITSIRNQFYFVNVGEYYEIDKLLNPPHEPKTVWDLKKGDEFWWISLGGFVCKSEWDGDCCDVDCRSQGNTFLTQEEAEFEVTRREVVTMVRKYTRPFKKEERNFYPYYVYVNGAIHFNADYCVLPIDYFATEDDIQKAIDEVGEEDFKKYYLGVTE